ncbi:hypothetical protein ArsFIN_33350 [Arsenophonus nasoniae]|uniref:Host cell division inhibitor Icd-like protein n=2 Tax=Arsenophonus nasoniae TaxID=638 RepID=A0A4P7KWP5_9GAMM|nr:hypothetical protein ArsFIN_33350 [Arsenophonus nasoniae]
MIPRDFNSFLIIRLIQAETEASPSSNNAVFIPCSNGGSTLSAICLFPFPDILMVDTWFTPIYTLFVHKVYGMCSNKTTPPNGIRRTTRGLTTNDRLFIEVAMYKYTFLIGKGKTRLSEINPIRLISVLAKSENEARLLAGNRHLVFVARQGVAHA